ncbi:MAG: dTDP-4-dehydrorhamnose 3,5-epimerase [Bacteroidia bacterium]|jgi:dTDP-4-dehydrorhamnose 3,5-epimerase
MKITKTKIDGLLILQPTVFQDSRGYFMESFRKDLFDAEGVPEFVQDNQSLSSKGTLRGLHFQAPPFAQGKLVRVISGSVLDVAVDIRKSSATYGQYFCIELSASNFTQFYIPPGFAHGFETLEDNTVFSYKCTNYYHKESEGGLLWNSKSLALPWRLSEHILSDKDILYPDLSEFESPFS